MKEDVTFRDLDHNVDTGKSALDDWYAGVRDTPISHLDNGDLARACRQRLYCEYVVPAAIKRLRVRPLAGDIYDGELLVALKAIKSDFWKEHETEARFALKLTHHVTDDELRDDISELRERLKAAVM